MSDEQWARCSSMGYYAACDFRAAYDRAIHEGLLEPSEDSKARKNSPSPYADLGTCIHWVLQSRMGCIFPGAERAIGRPITEHIQELLDSAADEERFTDEQFASACTLFNDDPDLAMAKMEAAAKLAQDHMPKAPDGRPWFAERHVKTRELSGHIDFLSQDKTVIVDLKTTSRPPSYGKMKPAHIFQLCAYKILVPTVTKAYVLYVSSKGDWVIPPEESGAIDFESEEGEELLGYTRGVLDHILSDDLYDRACPRFGSCTDNFCPYVEDCVNRLTPIVGKKTSPPKAEAAPPSMEDLFQ